MLHIIFRSSCWLPTQFRVRTGLHSFMSYFLRIFVEMRISDNPFGYIRFQIFMKVAVIEHNIHLFMYHLNLLKYVFRCWSIDMINHIVIDHLQICPNCNVKINGTSIFMKIVPTESIDYISKWSTHIDEIEHLKYSSLILWVHVAANLCAGSSLEIESIWL